MRKFITYVSFARLANLEFMRLVMKLVHVVAKHDPAALKIEGVYNLLVALLPKLKTLQVKSSKHPNSTELKVLRLKRRSLLVVITGKMRLLPKAQVDVLSAPSALVLPLLEKYLKNIVADKLNTQSEKINELFDELNGNAAVNAALATLGLKPYFDELKAIQSSIEQTGDAQLENKSVKKLKVLNHEIRAELYDAMTDLFNAIEIAKKENKELDYTALISEVNELLKPYQTDIKSRSTRSKNALLAADKSDAEIAASPTTDSLAV
ncbi:MAG: DUF6261 family protein [Bacteroidales bacterium]